MTIDANVAPPPPPPRPCDVSWSVQTSRQRATHKIFWKPTTGLVIGPETTYTRRQLKAREASEWHRWVIFEKKLYAHIFNANNLCCNECFIKQYVLNIRRAYLNRDRPEIKVSSHWTPRVFTKIICKTLSLHAFNSSLNTTGEPSIIFAIVFCFSEDWPDFALL